MDGASPLRQDYGVNGRRQMAKKGKKAKVKKAKVKKTKKYARAAKRAVKKRTVKKSAGKKSAAKKRAPRKVARALARSGNDPCQSFREAVDAISQNIAADRDLLNQPDLSPEDRAQIEERLSRRETDLGLAERALDNCVATHKVRA